MDTSEIPNTPPTLSRISNEDSLNFRLKNLEKRHEQIGKLKRHLNGNKCDEFMMWCSKETLQKFG